MMHSLEGKAILVTGGSSGIGQASALAMARAGAMITIADIDMARGEETVATIRARGGDAVFIRADVRDGADVEAAVHCVVRNHGRLDGAFNNAGILEGLFTSPVDCDESVWDRVIDVNLKGVWLCLKHELPQMRAQGGGVIVNHASIAGLYGNGIVGPAYIASKHGVVGLTRATALTYAAEGIRVNAICPGIINETVMSEAIYGDNPEREAQVRALYPAGRVGTLAEVAETVAWLFSDATSFMTGIALPVDGGLLAQ
ncbi:glucose 1-dehydrogenase [Ectothiorhodospiraceae bacterium WFHF3C12]|nr:glucose 1-dehydrogenase [Ectothiorhodospiraceae bacterium WFHF3C12]